MMHESGVLRLAPPERQRLVAHRIREFLQESPALPDSVLAWGW